MGLWTQLLLAAAAIFMGWMCYRFVRQNPQAFSRQNMSKSLTSMGVLALLLIVFIGFLVLLVRS